VNGVIEANTELGPSSWDPFDLMGINVTDGSGAYVPIGSSGTPGQTVGVTLWSPGDEDIISSSIDETLGVNGVAGVWIPQSLDAFIVFGGSVAQFARTVPYSGAITASFPIPATLGAVGFGPVVPLAYNPQTRQKCTGPLFGLGGLALTMPAGKAMNGGPLLHGNLANAQGVLSGGSFSVNIQLTAAIGYQVVLNSSGILGGPTVGSPGLSISGTYSSCSAP
jgi:hypothetical protein